MPWIPAAVWTAIQDEIAFLRAELATSRKHERTMDRVARQLPERPAAERRDAEPVPQEFTDLCAMWQQQGNDLYQRGLALRKRGVPWDRIIGDMRKATPGMEPVAVKETDGD